MCGCVLLCLSVCVCVFFLGGEAYWQNNRPRPFDASPASQSDSQQIPLQAHACTYSIRYFSMGNRCSVFAWQDSANNTATPIADSSA